MAQPVWVLSVDLQTKTATFQTGMSDVVKTARGAFDEIKTGAGEMSSAVGGSMMEARHGVMVTAELFGGHLPRSITAFITSLGPVAGIMEAAFPFLAIALGAKLFIDHLLKIGEASEKLAGDQDKLQITIANMFNSLDDKLLQAGIHADELSGHHLDALKKRLELIDHQSMAELIHSLENVAKVADAVFADLKTGWFQAGSGSTGAKHALEDFKHQYDLLLAKGKDRDAADLLGGTLGSAQRVLQLQKEAQDLSGKHPELAHGSATQEESLRYFTAREALKKSSVGFTEKEIQAQQTLVDVLQAQVGAQTRISELKKLESSNATTETHKKMGDDAGKSQWAEAQAWKREQEQIQKEQQERYRQAIAALVENEREKIAATDKGSAERLAAIDAAIKEENTRGLQETEFYRSLLRSRIDLATQLSDEEARIKAEAGKETAEHDLKMGELVIAAKKADAQLLRATNRTNANEEMAFEIQIANEEYALKMKAFAQEITALNKHDKDYQNKLKAIQDREVELTRSHENQVTQIKEKAQAERDARILSAEQRMQTEITRGLTQVIMHHQSFASMMAAIGDQVLTGMIQSALMLETAQGRERLSDARTAAAHAFEWGWKHGGPAAPVLAPVLAAGAFTAGLAFQEGGIVPGVGMGDVVPAMLTPGEAILPKNLTELLTTVARSGNGGQTGETHFHHHATYHIHAIDGASVKGMLDKHKDEFVRHFNRTLRRMNQ